MKYYVNEPFGCSDRWQPISKEVYFLLLQAYKNAEATAEQIARRIKAE